MIVGENQAVRLDDETRAMAADDALATPATQETIEKPAGIVAGIAYVRNRDDGRAHGLDDVGKAERVATLRGEETPRRAAARLRVR